LKTQRDCPRYEAGLDWSVRIAAKGANARGTEFSKLRVAEEIRVNSLHQPLGKSGVIYTAWRAVAGLLCVLALGTILVGQEPSRSPSSNHGFRVEGVVKDQTGAVVAGARVVLGSGNYQATETTGTDGKFVFNSFPAPTGVLTIQAKGFATASRDWTAEAAGVRELEIVLTPAPVAQEITVTATRTETPLSQTAANLQLLTSKQLSGTAALTLDDALRQVPGFTLFRRTGSRVANPTSQGVSLRGVGASGASRALVLEDGFPLNDPFGGWVYWDRVPRESVSQVEVVRGGESDLYGSDAMGGVINFVTRKPTSTALSFESSYGNEATPDASLWASVEHCPWSAAVDGEGFSTDGYILVDEAQRGIVDTPAGSKHEVVDLTLERKIGERGRVYLKPSYFRETRTNGTPLTYNRTHLRNLDLGADWISPVAGEFSFRGYGGPEIFDQTFSSVAADRNSESLVRSQRVPAQQTGLGLQWTRPAGMRQTLVAGFEGQEVRGSSNELGFFNGHVTSALGSGGRQRTAGVFGEDIIRLTSRWRITAAGRFDHWRNYDALSTTQPLSNPGPPRVTNFLERTETAFSPRLATLYRLTSHVSLMGSAYRAFRAPTLNELYRGFRVGNVQTNANSELTAERLTGAEAGAEFEGFHRRFTGRGAFFWRDISNPIANVTLSVTPNLITRQRQNLGRTRSRGVDLNATLHLTSTFDLSGGYEFVNATVLNFPANPALVGLEIPEIPRHVFTFQALYSNPSAGNRWARTTFGIQGRFVGKQFDDDLNQLPLGKFFVLDALVSHPIGHGVEIFAAVENLANESYAVAATPVLELGAPRLFRAGFRVNLGAR
jgi:outer membrane receptor protein involved in Fe transport